MRASALSPDSAFVELQAYRQGQNDLTGAQLIVYDQTGITQTPFTFTGAAANAQSQRTVLAGGTGVAGADFTFAGLGAALSPAGGAVCLPEATPPDCVSWGAFAGSSMLPFPGAGAPAPAIAEGQSLTRTIARGCALGLDAGGRLATPRRPTFRWGPPPRSPTRPSPTERDCVPCGGSDATLIGTDGKETIAAPQGGT